MNDARNKKLITSRKQQLRQFLYNLSGDAVGEMLGALLGPESTADTEGRALMGPPSSAIDGRWCGHRSLRRCRYSAL
ncbi:MAG: hypothetical protein QOH84_5932 [Kribbellaceae bacterium]|nr:hypothetical protein [Kribbellaceae bacterium]